MRKARCCRIYKLVLVVLVVQGETSLHLTPPTEHIPRLDDLSEGVSDGDLIALLIVTGFTVLLWRRFGISDPSRDIAKNQAQG